MSENRIQLVKVEQPKTATSPSFDAGRWLTVSFIQLAKRFLGMAQAAGFEEAKQKHECPKCGWRG